METLIYHAENRIGYITLNRPEKRNALNALLVHELLQVFNDAENDPRVTVVVVKANGDAFCAGADLGYLQELQSFSFEENVKDSTRLKELFYRIYTLKKIVIAQVEGHALAGGCGLANVCDFTFAAPEAKFGYTEVKIGFIPAIVMVFLIRKIGEARAKQLLLSGDLISADEARQISLVHNVFPRDSLAKEVTSFATKLITTNSGNSMMTAKRMMADIQSMPLEDALTYAAEMNAAARGTDDCKKGIAAFLNKEKIGW